MKLIIKVTAAHIKKGKRGEPEKCPLALALRKYVPEAQVVGPYFYTAPGEIKSLPLAAREFVRRFDDGESVEPMQFSINVHKYFLKKRK